MFILRLDLIDELDKILPMADADDQRGDRQLRSETAETLRKEVAGMNPNNFIVRPKRKLVERYSDPDAWKALGLEQRGELIHGVGGLPSELMDTDQDAKQFDALMLQLQLAVLRAESRFTKLRKQVEAIAGLLSEKANIPMVRAQMALIEEIQTEEFWQDVTPAMLENVRKRLRALIKLIEKTARKAVYTDFEDQIGAAEGVDFPVFAAGIDFQKFRAKARDFLREHENNPTVKKLRSAERLNHADLEELETMLISAGVGTSREIEHAKELSNGLGLFLRSLVGLDRSAAKAAFNAFLNGKTPTANQIEFLNIVIDHLSEQGFMDPARLYGSPFIDFSPKGVDGVFNPEQVGAIFSILQEIKQAAAVQ